MKQPVEARVNHEWAVKAALAQVVDGSLPDSVHESAMTVIKNVVVLVNRGDQGPKGQI